MSSLDHVSARLEKQQLLQDLENELQWTEESIQNRKHYLKKKMQTSIKGVT